MYGGRLALVALEPVELMLVLTLMPVLALLVVVVPAPARLADPAFWSSVLVCMPTVWVWPGSLTLELAE